MFVCVSVYFFFFKQKTAYEMRISDWSSDVCSSGKPISARLSRLTPVLYRPFIGTHPDADPKFFDEDKDDVAHLRTDRQGPPGWPQCQPRQQQDQAHLPAEPRSEEHTSELQSLMRSSYAVFCLKKKTHQL